MSAWVIVLAAVVGGAAFVVWDRPKNQPDDDRDAAQQKMRQWLKDGDRSE